MANQHDDPLDGEFLNNMFAMGILVDKNMNITISNVIIEHAVPISIVDESGSILSHLPLNRILQ